MDNISIDNNQWNNTDIGNYWDDYVGVDLDDNGIGDTPYTNILGTAGSQDAFPIYNDGADPPIITITSPANTTSHSSAPTFTITIDDPSIDKRWYSINDGTGWSQNITFSGTTVVIDANIWESLQDGDILIRFYANDTFGALGFKDAIIEKITPCNGSPSLPSDDPDPMILIFSIILLSVIGIPIVIVIYKKKSAEPRP